ncbi:MAG: type I glutamate--ammonia ligase [Gemmatimonadales bacterium]|jgi:glutamine synthetase
MAEAVATRSDVRGGAAVEAAREELERSAVRWVNCLFTDLRGILQSFTVPREEFSEGEAFASGIGFDGSSVRGFKSIDESDMLWIPDAETLRIIPWIDDPVQKSAFMLGDIHEAFGGGASGCDPRGAARRVMSQAAELGFEPLVAPEIEFFLFRKYDPTRLVFDYWASPSGGQGDSWAGPRPMPESPELYNGGPAVRPKEGYFRAPPEDSTHEFRIQLAHYLGELGIEVEYHHHEVATAGQVELNFKPRNTLATADSTVVYKFAARNVAKMHGFHATFMPKPLYLDNASGMHVHQSLWADGKNVFFDTDDEYAELSDVGRYYIGGLLAHAPALTAICCSTVNSYKRLVPGFEAPINVCWSRRNRSALVRVPVYQKGEAHVAAKRIEYRAADPACNPYLALAAQLAAGLDGIKNRIDPGEPVDHDVYELSEVEKAAHGIGTLPTTLDRSLEALENDRVIREALGDAMVESFLGLKGAEWNQYCLQLTPWEVVKYLDY